MDQFLPIKKQLRIQKWQQRIEECQASGMKVYEWCAINGISKDAYYYWLRKCRAEALSNLPEEVKANLPTTNSSVTLKKLEVTAPVSGTQAAVVVRIPNATIEVAEGTSRQTVEAVLLALKTVC